MNNKEVLQRMGSKCTATIYQGDCMAGIEQLEANTLDGVIIDPPYSSGGTFSTQRKASTAEKYLQSGHTIRSELPSFASDNMDMRSFTLFMREVLFLARSKTKDQGVCCVFIDFRNLPAVADALQMAGWTWRGVAVWDKMNSRPQMGRFRNQCEYIVWGSNGSMPVDRGVPVLEGVFRCQNVPVQKANHQTEKPLALMQKVIEIVPEGGTVLDCFMGSGTTGVASVLGGRNFVGIELDPYYYKVAKGRIESATAQESMF